MITVERDPIRGHYVVTALVQDGRSMGEWYMSRQYYGYPKKVAVKMYREYCRGNGINIVRGS
jgi:hypothetical protein